MLILAGFDPEMRRQIGEIREDGDIRRCRPGGGERAVHGAIEVGNERDHEVGLGPAPVAA
jgi:hypothetical protein